jgi:hypothetical protein
MDILGDAPLCWVVQHLESSSLHSSYERVFRMAEFTGIVDRMYFQGTTSTRCNQVGGWMEKLFSNGFRGLFGHLQSYTTIAFTYSWISFQCTCNTTTHLLCNRLALELTSFQWDTLPYCRHWIKQYLREESIAFMVNNPEGTKPTQLDITHWIRWSWDQVQHSTILNTWHSIGIHPFHNN